MAESILKVLKVKVLKLRCWTWDPIFEDESVSSNPTPWILFFFFFFPLRNNIVNLNSNCAPYGYHSREATNFHRNISIEYESSLMAASVANRVENKYLFIYLNYFFENNFFLHHLCEFNFFCILMLISLFFSLFLLQVQFSRCFRSVFCSDWA